VFPVLFEFASIVDKEEEMSNFFKIMRIFSLFSLKKNFFRK